MLIQIQTGKQPVYCNEHTTEIISSGIAVSNKCSFNGFILSTGGKKVTLTIYDNNEASGKKLFPTTTLPGKSGLVPLSINPGLFCRNGIYVEIKGKKASIIIVYDQG